jgi:hypothetical protein
VDRTPSEHKDKTRFKRSRKYLIEDYFSKRGASTAKKGAYIFVSRSHTAPQVDIEFRTTTIIGRSQ